MSEVETFEDVPLFEGGDAGESHWRGVVADEIDGIVNANADTLTVAQARIIGAIAQRVRTPRPPAED